jgi:type II secretory pathway pseudopilin PulG
LIELMVALVVSSLLVGMILAIFLRMSLAYRGQQQIASLQQVLSSARAMIEDDARQAGHQMAQGFQIALDLNNKFSPVMVVNNTTGPDELRFVYADASVQAVFTDAGPIAGPRNVDDVTGFAVNDLVAAVTITGTEPNPTDPAGAPLVIYDTCIVRIVGIQPPTQLVFDTVPPYGTATNAHCIDAIANSTMLYKAMLRAYRIDPTAGREADGVLQISPTGDMFGLNDWQDMAYGFTDLQVATQFFDDDAFDTADPDTDAKRDWHSGEQQETLTRPPILKPYPANKFMPTLQMSISLVSRTDRDVEGVATPATPELQDSSNVNNNMLGDRASVALPSAVDPRLMGFKIYRYVTFRSDFRNIGVGR